MKIVAVGTAFLLFLVAFATPQDTAKARSPHPKLKTVRAGLAVYLHKPQGPFKIGAPMRLEVDFSNDGKQPFLVCRDLSIGSESCFWQFETRDASGRPLPTAQLVADRIPGAPAPFPDALVSNWIALAPNYRYGMMLNIENALPEPRPGHYTVRATLTSDGPGSQSVYNDLLHYPKELANLPYPGWRGRVVSNWVSIDIVSAK